MVSEAPARATFIQIRRENRRLKNRSNHHRSLAWSLKRALVIVAAIFAVLLGAGVDARPAAVDDILANVEIRSVVASPDGTRFAVVVQRRRGRNEYLTHDWFTNSRCDLWIVSDKGQAENITHGTLDGSTSFMPVWSPDGVKLAFLSDKGGDNIRLFIWQSYRDAPTLVNSRGIDMDANFGAESPQNPLAAIWLDNRTLMTSLLPLGSSPRRYRYDLDVSSENRDWAKTRAGDEPSVSVVGDGQAAENRDLVRVDVQSLKVRIIASGRFQAISASPDKKWLALVFDAGALKKSRFDLTPFIPLRTAYNLLEYRKGEVAVVPSDGRAGLKVLRGIFNPISWTIFGFPKWSADSSQFALLAKSAPNSQPWPAPDKLFLVYPSVPTSTVLGSDIQAYEWLGRQVIVLRRGQLYASEPNNRLRRLDLSAPRPPSMAKYAEPEASLIKTPLGLLSIVAGKFRIIQQKENQQLVDTPGQTLGKIIWPHLPKLLGNANASFITDNNGSLIQICVTVDGIVLHRVKRPTETAVLTEYSPVSRVAAFVDTTSKDHSLLLENTQSGQYIRSLEFDQHWREIDDPKKTIIPYTARNGRKIFGALYLPYNYRKGSPLPLIVWVYPGVQHEEGEAQSAHNEASKWNDDWTNLSKFTSAGYAVFEPSIPLSPGRINIEGEITGNVLPGISRLITLGIAKRGEIGLRGNSYGSLVALFLLEKTHIFSAAITSANFVDLISYHGVFRPESRRSAVADSYSQQNFAETEAPNGTLRLMETPAGDMATYLRNSPLMHAGSIGTPLMLIQGEFDAVPMESVESLYSLLKENGVQVELVRYWGEAHIIKSPANIRDDWQREISWFNRYLKPKH